MKKILLTTFMFFIFAPGFAATSGSLSVTGMIAVVNDLSVSSYSEATNLDIIGGENGTLVADISELSNNPDGYTIQLTSTNNGKLINTTNSIYQVSYQISYDNGAYLSPINTPNTVKNVYFLNQKTTDVSPIKIRFSPYVNAGSGSYEDSITLSIVAN